MERLNFENLGFGKMKKKLRLHLSLTVGNDFTFEFHSFIHQTLRFMNFRLFFGKTNLKCDCKLIKIPPFFWKIPLQTFRIQPCMNGSEHIFDICILSLKTKEYKRKLVCNACITLCRYSAVYFNLKLNFRF